MKILEIAPPWVKTPPDGYGGAEWVVYNQVEGLIDRGHDVTLFATKDSKTRAQLKYVYDNGLMEQGIPVSIPTAALVHYDQALELANEFDIVHIHLSTQSGISVLPLLKQLKVPHLITMHNQWPSEIDEENAFAQKDQQYMKYYTDNVRLLSISKTMEAQCLKGNLEPAGVVYNSVNAEKYEYSLEPGSYYTWLGRIVPYKGLKEAIETVKQINGKLVFGGVVRNNVKEEIDYFNQLKPLIDGQQIIFLGAVNHIQKNDLLKNATALLNPISWEEPFNMVVVEAMACGTPVIAFNRGAMPEIIKDGKNGFLVENITEMVEKTRLINEISREYCRSFVTETFSVATTARQLDYFMKNEIRHYLNTHYETTTYPTSSASMDRYSTQKLWRN